MHRQLTILLVVQLTSPVILMVGPISIAFAMGVLLKQSMPTVVGEMTFLFMTVYATTNSLLTIIFVTPFRVYTRRLMVKPFKEIKRRMSYGMNKVQDMGTTGGYPLSSSDQMMARVRGIRKMNTS
jgi:hypothetical protein